MTLTIPPAVENAEDRPVTPLDRKALVRNAILTGPIPRTLFTLAWPTMAVLLAQTAINIAEAFYVGFLGTASLAGVSLVFPLVMLMMTMSAGGIGSGVASAVARAIGAGRKHDADAIVFHSILLAIIIGAIFTVGPIWGGPALYRALGGRNQALTAALLYSNYIFAGSVGVWIVNVLGAALRGSGNVKVPAIVTFTGAVLLIPVSPALIFGFGPFPRMGIAGAGIVFAIYFSGAAVALIAYMISTRSSLSLRFARLERRIFADILKVGVPAALSTVQTNLTVILVTAAVGLFGTSYLAGYGIASRLDYVLIPILFGLSSAVLTMVGVNMGAGQTMRARKIAWTGGLLGVAITEGIGLVVAIFPALWLHLFSHDPSVLAPATTYLRIVAPVYGFLGLGFVLSFASQGTGHILWPFIGVTARLLVAAGIGWIAVTYFGAGVFALSIIIAASLAIYAALCAVAMTSKEVWKPTRCLAAARTVAGR